MSTVTNFGVPQTLEDFNYLSDHWFIFSDLVRFTANYEKKSNLQTFGRIPWAEVRITAKPLSTWVHGETFPSTSEPRNRPVIPVLKNTRPGLNPGMSC
jgi:hypothetical protein